MSRAVAVARVHAVDVSHAIWPWAILAISFVVNVTLWVALRNVDGFQKTTGGLLSLYVTAAFVAGIAISRQLPFMLGLGATRTAFMAGSLIYAGTSAAVTGVVLTLLNLLESATGGVTQGGRFFRVPWLTDVPTYQLLAVYAVPMLLALALGAFTAGLYARFGGSGMLVGAAVGMGSVTAASALATAAEAWGAVGEWVVSLTPLTLTAWLFVATAGMLGATYLVLRRVAV